jgi:hypothetical protein
MARFTFRSLAAAAAVAAACASGASGAATIYKCFDRSLGVLYTDQPCKGEELDIRAGSPDPAAIAELSREREALARSAAQRVADNRRFALSSEAPVVNYMAPPDVAPYPYADFGVPGYYGYGYGYGNAPGAARGMRQDGRGAGERRERIQTVPNPPRGLPRR